MRNAYYIRLDRGETLTDVAEATRLDAGTIRDFERGDRTPHTATVKRLADHYGLPALTLLGVAPDAAEDRFEHAGRSSVERRGHR